jgi:hypothetical protein
MNAEQRRIAIAEERFTCAITKVAYDPRTYFDIEATLRPFARLTADHKDGRRTVKGVKVDEGSDNIWIILGEAHWFKDNAGRDAQIKWLKKKIAEAEWQLEPERAAHMRTVLVFLEEGHTLRDYGTKHIAERGPYSAAYDHAMAQERDVDAPIRKETKRVARSAAYKRAKAKAGGSRLSKRKSPPHARSAPAKSKVPQKILDQQARAVLNGTPTP